MAIWALSTYLEAPVEPEVTTSALVSWQKKENRLLLSLCLIHCANMRTREWKREDPLRTIEQLRLGPASLSQCVSVLSYQRVDSTSFRFQPLLSPKVVLFNYLYSMAHPSANDGRSCTPNNGSILKQGLMNKGQHQWLKIHRKTDDLQKRIKSLLFSWLW